MIILFLSVSSSFASGQKDSVQVSTKHDEAVKQSGSDKPAPKIEATLTVKGSTSTVNPQRDTVFIETPVMMSDELICEQTLTASQKMMVLNKLSSKKFGNADDIQVCIDYLDESLMSGVQNMTILKGVLSIYSVKEDNGSNKRVVRPLATIAVKGMGRSRSYALNHLLASIKMEDISYFK